MAIFSPPPRPPIPPIQVDPARVTGDKLEMARLEMLNHAVARLHAIETRLFDIQHRPIIRLGQASWIATIIVALLLTSFVAAFLGLLFFGAAMTPK